MFGAITSLMRSTLPPRCRPAVSFAYRSHIRHFTSRPPRVEATWTGVVDNSPAPVRQTLEGVLTAEDIWKNKSVEAIRRANEKPPANAYAGRSVNVKGANVGEAFGRLQAILSRNKVQAQLRRAERHEKKGVKRRRLSSERWRKQFAHEVRRKVQLVAKIRNRGA
ncbi:hypothetical protein C0991_003810 [Blastosporella zonata]|nr:hypothetical protein C0991_003810 [Blastosporella zonata]